MVFMSDVNQYSHAESLIVEDEVQSMNCEGPNTNTHKEEERAMEQGHAVESADDQELQWATKVLRYLVVKPEANKEQPVDKEPLSEADYMKIIDVTVNIINECKGFGIVLCRYFPLIIHFLFFPRNTQSQQRN